MRIRLSDATKELLNSQATVIALLEVETPLLRFFESADMMQLRMITNMARKMIWVTRSMLPRAAHPDFSLASGLARTLMLEQPSLTFYTLNVAIEELSQQRTARNITFILNQSLDSPRDYEYVQDRGVLYISRFTPDDQANHWFQQVQNTDNSLELSQAKPCQVDTSFPEALHTARFVKQEPSPEALDPESLVVEVLTVGLNPESIKKGKEACVFSFCGIVTRASGTVSHIAPGDRVMAMAPCALGTHQIVPAWACVKLRPEDSPDLICTLPSAYATAFYALNIRAQVQRGETVFIHCGASPCGMAAILLAKSLGSEVYATVHDESEKKLLMQYHQIRAKRIFYTQDGSFVKSALKATKGYGMDVVLNILPGEMIHDTWRICSSFGRFVELGNQDLFNVEKFEMGMFKRGISFSAVDLEELYKDRRPRAQEIWTRLV